MSAARGRREMHLIRWTLELVADLLAIRIFNVVLRLDLPTRIVLDEGAFTHLRIRERCDRVHLYSPSGHRVKSGKGAGVTRADENHKRRQRAKWKMISGQEAS